MRLLGPRVRPLRPEEVTSRNLEAEAPPAAVGLSHDDVNAMWSAVERLYRTGLHPAIALCVRRRGRVVIDRAIGHLRGNAPGDGDGAPKVPIRHDSLFLLFSASKAITAMLVQLLAERGELRLDAPVAEYIPEFGRHGKDRITVRHVLTHRAGIPTLPGVRFDASLLLDEGRILDALCDARCGSEPGERLAYHALTGGFVLGEVVRRVAGKDVRALARDEIATPLGFRSFQFGAPERLDEIAHNAFTGAPAVPPISWGLERAFGTDLEAAVELSNDPRFHSCVIPSGNLVSTADETCRFFQLLLDGGELDGVRIFERATVAQAIAPTGPFAFDALLRLPMRYGMGFMLGSPWLGFYGRSSARAFGHIGFTNVVAWADPDRAISACLLTSGKPFLTPGQLHWLAVMYTIAARTRA